MCCRPLQHEVITIHNLKYTGDAAKFRERPRSLDPSFINRELWVQFPSSCDGLEFANSNSASANWNSFQRAIVQV